MIEQPVYDFGVVAMKMLLSRLESPGSHGARRKTQDGTEWHFARARFYAVPVMHPAEAVRLFAKGGRQGNLTPEMHRVAVQNGNPVLTEPLAKLRPVKLFADLHSPLMSEFS